MNLFLDNYIKFTEPAQTQTNNNRYLSPISTSHTEIYLYEMVIKSLIELKDYKNGLEYVDKALKINENESSFYKYQCYVFICLKNSEKAIGTIKKLMELNPNDEKLLEILNDLIKNQIGKKGLDINRIRNILLN